MFVLWAEVSADDLSPLRQVYIRQYTTPTATTKAWVNLGNDFTNTVPDGVKYDLANNAHSARFATLAHRLHLVHVDDTPYSAQIRTQVTALYIYIYIYIYIYPIYIYIIYNIYI